MRKLESELEKIQACILKIREADPSRIDKLKCKLPSFSPKAPSTPIPSTPDTPEVEMKEEDKDLLMAIALQKKEDAMVDIMDSEDDFSYAKKRKVTTKKRVTRK